MSATLPDPVIVAHRVLAVLGALILAGATMVFGAPSSLATSATNSQGSQAAGQVIKITDTLSSQHLMATPGTTVTWVNNDDDVHRIKSDKGASIEFDSGVLEPGERYSHRFTSASDVTYRDALDARNSSYVGMVMVMTMKPAGANAVTATTSLAPLAQPQQQPFVLASSGSGSDGGDESAGGPNAKHVTVALHGDDDIRPSVVTIAKGGSVTWFNDDSEDHTASGAGGINSGRLHRDERYTHTFNKPGTYDYVCAYHAAMQGTVRVANASGDVPPPPDNGGGGGGGGNPPPPSNGGQKVAISIGANFSPRNVSIPTGSVVTWTNNDGSPHTATGQGGISSGNLNGGQKYTKTFNTAGTFHYVCSYHSDMSGTITVTGAGGGNPPPPGGGGGGNPPPPGGGGGGKTPTPPPPGGGGSKAPAKASVSIHDDYFVAKTVTIAAGGTVSWTNTGKNAHTVTGQGFDSGPVMAGNKYSHRFSKAGTYTYQCVFHSGMTATVKVVGAGGKVPPPPPGGGGGGKNPPPPGGGGGGSPGGGGGTAPGGGSAPGSKTVTVTMGADSFSPSTISARVGDTVVWKNSSPVPHTVTGGPLNSGMVSPGQSYTEVLRQQGTITYHCEYHSGMTGTVKVAAAPAGVKLPPPSAGGGVSGPSTGGGLPAPSTGGSSSGDTSSAAPAPGSESYTINMSGSAFDPQVLEARVGDKVTWVNKDPMPHNVTGGSLDSGTMMPNATYTTVLSEPGTIEYECTFHPGMTGTLKVAAAPPGTEVPDAADSSTSGGSMEGMDMGSEPSQKSAEPAEGAQNHTVNIVDFMFDPDPLEVHVGDTVTFVNKDAAPHTATASDKSWDSGNLNQGDSWTLKVEKVGTFDYICTYHPTMKGTLIVKPKSEEISASSPGSDSSGAATTMTSASQVAGFSSGWLALLAFLAGLQLQSRFSSRRNSNSV